MPATYCPEKGDRRVTFFCDDRYLVHTISDVTIKYSKGRMIRQQPEGHDTFASGDSCFCVAKVVRWLSLSLRPLWIGSATSGICALG